MLACLYHSAVGRGVLKVLTWKPLSVAAGKLLDRPISCCLINPFIRKNKIDLSDFQVEKWVSFNDFFVRRIKPECRPIDMTEDAFIAPCDGLLQVFPIGNESTFQIKGISYRLPELMRNEKLAEEFLDGTCLIFRLTPTHYHRYVYPDDGVKGENVAIAGVLHTVQPVAVEATDVFVQNSREYTILETKHFGNILYMEVGAMLVGRICNYHGKHSFSRGEEKGRFEFGGSTIVLLVKKGAVELNPVIWDYTKDNREFPVKMGQKLN